MAPHIEVHCQAVVGGGVESVFGSHWEIVPNTNHHTGDTVSKAAKLAHELLRDDPEKYREVADKNGKTCLTTQGR